MQQGEPKNIGVDVLVNENPAPKHWSATALRQAEGRVLSSLKRDRTPPPVLRPVRILNNVRRCDSDG
jgi:hypothetical protein